MPPDCEQPPSSSKRIQVCLNDAKCELIAAAGLLGQIVVVEHPTEKADAFFLRLRRAVQRITAAEEALGFIEQPATSQESSKEKKP